MAMALEVIWRDTYAVKEVIKGYRGVIMGLSDLIYGHSDILVGKIYSLPLESNDSVC